MNHTPFNTTYTIPPWGYSSMYRSTKTLTTTSTRRGTHSGRPLSQKSLTQCPSSAPTRRPSILESPANTFSRTKTRKLRRNSATLSPCLATPHAVFFFFYPLPTSSLFSSTTSSPLKLIGWRPSHHPVSLPLNLNIKAVGNSYRRAWRCLLLGVTTILRKLFSSILLPTRTIVYYRRL